MQRYIFLILLTLVSGLALSQVVEIHNGFGTGEEYLEMSLKEQRTYAMGLVNGMLLAPMFGAPKTRMLRLEQCITGMTDTQVAAILSKYLRDNPSRWHETPHTSMYAALIDSCPKPIAPSTDANSSE